MSRTAACTLAVGVVLFLGTGAGTAHAARLGAGGGGEGAGGALVASRSFSGVAGRPAVLGPVRIRTSRVLVADRDRDGVVTLAEAVAYFEARFGRMDADGDDALSADEFVAGDRTGAAVPAAVLATSRRERAPGFEAFDLDGDGRVSPEEFFLARTQGAAAGASDRRERLRRAAFAGLDTDRDGVVGRAEYAAAGAGHFAERDADSDGRVTIWEFRSGPAFRYAARPRRPARTPAGTGNRPAPRAASGLTVAPRRGSIAPSNGSHPGIPVDGSPFGEA